MSSTQTIAKVVNDTNGFVDYLRNTLLQAPSDLRYDGTNVILTFSPALSAGNQTLLNTLVANYVDPDTRETTNDCNISPYSSSSTALASNAVFTGSWEDVARYASMTVSVRASSTSATLGLQLQFGVTSPQVDASNAYTYSSADVGMTVTAPVGGRYFRVLYTNGTTAQTSFGLSTFWSVTESLPVGQLRNTISDQSDAALVRSVLTSRGDNVQYSTLRADEQSQLRVRMPTNYDRLIVATSTPIIQLSFNYLVNTDETKTTLAGSGTVTFNTGRALVNCGAAINSSAFLQSDRYCRCGAGNKLHILLGAAFSTPATGSRQLVGGGTAANGVFFGYFDTTFGVVIRSNSVDTFTAATNWNVDKMDGTGPSGMLLNPLLGNSYALSFDATGYGSVSFHLLAPVSGTSRLLFPDCVMVHRISFANVSQAVGILNPQFPCAAYCGNTTSNTAKTVYISSFCAFTDGPPRRTLLLRTVDNLKAIVSTVYAVHFSIQNKAIFNGVANSSTVHLRQLTAAGSGGTRNIGVAIVLNPTFTTAGTYADVNGNNSVLSFSTTANMAITANSGITLWTGFFYANDQTWDLSELDIMLSPGDFCAFVCKISTATSTAVSMAVNFAEFQ